MSGKFTTKLCLLALASLTVFATGCGDDDDDDVVSPVTDDAACKLMSITDEDDDVITLEYNAQGYLIKAVEEDNDVSTYIYDASNRLVKSEEHEDGRLSSYMTFEYKDGLMSAVKYYEADGELAGSETYKYDANKRVVESTSDGGGRTTYTYDSKGNVTKEEEFFGDELSFRIVYENYDDKPTYLSAVKGLMMPMAGLSKNNPKKETYTSFYDGEEGDSYIQTNTYKYNSNGFPTEISSSDGSGNNSVRTFSYQCK